MPKKKQTKSTRNNPPQASESDSAYFLKLVLVVLLGTFWLRFETPLVIDSFAIMGIPLGLILGLFIVHKYEHFDEDRKIWFALLVVVTIVSMFMPTGIVL